MEYLPQAEFIKSVVEVVPGLLYWAAVDIGKYAEYLRKVHHTHFYKPQIKSAHIIRDVLKPARIRSRVDVTETGDLPATPPKSRRTSEGCKVAMLPTRDVRVVYTDRVFFYRPLAHDFGPLDLSTTYRYIDFLDDMREDQTPLIHISDHRRVNWCSNSACLVSIYGVIRFGLNSADIDGKFGSVPSQQLPPFRDASTASQNTFPLTIGNCCEAVEQSIRLRWVDWNHFDVDETERLQHIDNGDLNWIIENKFIAFAGPSSDRVDEDGLEVHAPSHYVPIFQRMGVTDVVRLNVANYDPVEFSSHGIAHHDLFFEDGSCPPPNIVSAFLDIVKAAKGAVAVHCKAGLGRSASMIGLAVMKEYKVPAKVFIAWARLARSGSVIGPQQQFLVQNEPRSKSRETSPLGSRLESVQTAADVGQGTRLLKRKKLNAVRAKHGSA